MRALAVIFALFSGPLFAEDTPITAEGYHHCMTVEAMSTLLVNLCTEQRAHIARNLGLAKIVRFNNRCGAPLSYRNPDHLLQLSEEGRQAEEKIQQENLSFLLSIRLDPRREYPQRTLETISCLAIQMEIQNDSDIGDSLIEMGVFQD